MADTAFQGKQQGRAKRAFVDAVGRSSLPSVTRHMLMVMAHYARLNADALLAWPTTETLAKVMGVDRRSISNHLKIAVNGGWLDRRKMPAKYGRYARNVYALLTPDSAKNGNVVPKVEAGCDLDGENGSGVPIIREASSKKPGNDVPTIKNAMNQVLHAEGRLVVSRPGADLTNLKPTEALPSDQELRERASSVRASPSLKRSDLMRRA